MKFQVLIKTKRLKIDIVLKLSCCTYPANKWLNANKEARISHAQLSWVPSIVVNFYPYFFHAFCGGAHESL